MTLNLIHIYPTSCAEVLLFSGAMTSSLSEISVWWRGFLRYCRWLRLQWSTYTKLIAAASNGTTYDSSAEFTYTRTWWVGITACEKKGPSLPFTWTRTMDNHNRVFGEANNYSGYSGLSYLYHSSILLTQTSSTIATMLGDECKTKWWRGGKTENLVRTPVATIYASKRVTSCADLQPEDLVSNCHCRCCDSNLAVRLVYK